MHCALCFSFPQRDFRIKPAHNQKGVWLHDLNRTVKEAAQKKVKKYQGTYANDHGISFLPAVVSTTGRIDAEFLRLLFWHAHRESEEFSRLTGQLAQPNPDTVHSKRAAFFNSLKSKVGHIVAKASAMRVNLNLSPTVPSDKMHNHCAIFAPNGTYRAI